MDRQRMLDLVAHPERATSLEIKLLAQYGITCQDTIETFLEGAAVIGELVDNAQKLRAVMDRAARRELGDQLDGIVKTNKDKN